MKHTAILASIALAHSTLAIASSEVENDRKSSTIDIQNSMRMADTSPRFLGIDNLLGDLKVVDQGAPNLSSKHDPLNLGLRYSSRGQDANGRDIIGLNASVHTSTGFSAEGYYLHGLEGLRDLSKDGRYDAGRLRLAQSTPLGRFFIGADITGADVGSSKRVSRFQEELSGETRRAVFGHTYSIEGLGSLSNSVTWASRSQTYDKYQISEKQDYRSWNSSFSGQYGASYFSASITQGLSGERHYDAAPLMGDFNPKFYAVQVGYGLQGLILRDQLGYAVSGSYFRGSKDMPSAERMIIGGSGRGSSHEVGIVSGYEGTFGEARLYWMRAPLLADLSLRPYLSVNGARASHPTGGDFEVLSSEIGIVGRWRDFSSALSYSKSVKDDHLDHDSRLNLDLNYTF